MLRARHIYLLIVSVFLVTNCSPKAWYPGRLEAQLQTISDTLLLDSAVYTSILPFKLSLDSSMGIVIGTTEKELTKGGFEHVLGNFIADALFTKAVDVYQTQVDFAVITSGGIRTSLKKGNITVGDIYELMPFENELLLLEVNGQQINKLFEYGFERKNISIANAQVRYDKYGHIQSLKIAGEPFDENKVYTMAISDYLALGGDGMSFLKLSESALSKQYKVRDAIIDYITELSEEGIAIDGFIEKRVSILP